MRSSNNFVKEVASLVLWLETCSSVITRYPCASRVNRFVSVLVCLLLLASSNNTS